MSKFKFFFSFIIVLLSFRFSGFVSCAYNLNDLVNPSDFSVDDLVLDSNGFMPVRILIDGNYSLKSTFPFNGQTSTPYYIFSGGASLSPSNRYAYLYLPNGSNGNGSGVAFALYCGIKSNGIITSSNRVSGFTGGNFFNKESNVFSSTSSGSTYYDVWFDSSGGFAEPIISTNVPIFDHLDDVRNFIINGDLDLSKTLNDSLTTGFPDVPSAESLGFLTDVKYFVDSASFQYNPSNTPEYVSWGQYSSTGLDLSDSRYQVEFAIEDQTTWLRNNGGATNQFLGNISGAPIETLVDTVHHVLSVLPLDDAKKMYSSGKAYNGGNYGKVSSLGLFPASSPPVSLSVVSSYIDILSSDTSYYGSKLYRQLNNFYNNPTSGYWNQVYKDWQDGSALEISNFSYNILARIVDTNSGAVGSWSCIDRHNVPYWMGDNLDVLNGGITYHTNYLPYSFKPSGGVFSLPVDEPDKRETEPVGVSPFAPDNMGSGGDSYYSNYYYSPMIFYRSGDQVINDYNIIEKDGDFILIYNNRPSSNPSGDDGVGLGEALGLIATFYVLWNWYSALFGGLLPIWAVVCIPVFSGLFVAVTLWKFGRNLIGG